MKIEKILKGQTSQKISYLFDDNLFKSIEEPLEEISDNSVKIDNKNQNEYICTNLLFKKNMQISEIQVESIEYFNLQQKLIKIFEKQSTDSWKSEIIDPKKEVKKAKIQGHSESLFEFSKIEEYAKMAFDIYLNFHRFQQPEQSRSQSIDNVQLNILQKKVENLHTNKFSCQQIHNIKTLLYQNFQRFFKRNKFKYTNISKKNAKLIQAWKMRKQDAFSIKDISKRLKISMYQVRNIDTYESLDDLKMSFQSKNYKRFKMLHQRAKLVILNCIESSTTLLQLKDILKFLKSKTSIKLSQSTLRKYLKEELMMSYRIIRPISFNHNKQENQLQRQFAAAKYIELLSQNKKVINIDETIINQTDNRKRGWAYYGVNNQTCHLQRLSQVNMIAAVSNQGEFYYTLNKGKTNSQTFVYFLIKIIDELQRQDINWRQNTIFMIDNAPYHRSKKMQEYFQILQIPILYLGPYHFKMASVEHIFAYLKSKDLNPLCTKAYTKGQINVYLKELAIHISRMDFSWIPYSFIKILSSALDSLSLKPL